MAPEFQAPADEDDDDDDVDLFGEETEEEKKASEARAAAAKASVKKKECKGLKITIISFLIFFEFVSDCFILCIINLWLLPLMKLMNVIN